MARVVVLLVFVTLHNFRYISALLCYSQMGLRECPGELCTFRVTNRSYQPVANPCSSDETSAEGCAERNGDMICWCSKSFCNSEQTALRLLSKATQQKKRRTARQSGAFPAVERPSECLSVPSEGGGAVPYSCFAHGVACLGCVDRVARQIFYPPHTPCLDDAGAPEGCKTIGQNFCCWCLGSNCNTETKLLQVYERFMGGGGGGAPLECFVAGVDNQLTTTQECTDAVGCRLCIVGEGEDRTPPVWLADRVCAAQSQLDALGKSEGCTYESGQWCCWCSGSECNDQARMMSLYRNRRSEHAVDIAPVAIYEQTYQLPDADVPANTDFTQLGGDTDVQALIQSSNAYRTYDVDEAPPPPYHLGNQLPETELPLNADFALHGGDTNAQNSNQAASAYLYADDEAPPPLYDLGNRLPEADSHLNADFTEVGGDTTGQILNQAPSAYRYDVVEAPPYDLGNQLPETDLANAEYIQVGTGDQHPQPAPIAYGYEVDRAPAASVYDMPDQLSRPEFDNAQFLVDGSDTDGQQQLQGSYRYEVDAPPLAPYVLAVDSLAANYADAEFTRGGDAVAGIADQAPDGVGLSCFSAAQRAGQQLQQVDCPLQGGACAVWVLANGFRWPLDTCADPLESSSDGCRPDGDTTLCWCRRPFCNTADFAKTQYGAWLRAQQLPPRRPSTAAQRRCWASASDDEDDDSLAVQTCDGNCFGCFAEVRPDDGERVRWAPNACADDHLLNTLGAAVDSLCARVGDRIMCWCADDACNTQPHIQQLYETYQRFTAVESRPACWSYGSGAEMKFCPEESTGCLVPRVGTDLDFEQADCLSDSPPVSSGCDDARCWCEGYACNTADQMHRVVDAYEQSSAPSCWSTSAMTGQAQLIRCAIPSEVCFAQFQPDTFNYGTAMCVPRPIEWTDDYCIHDQSGAVSCWCSADGCNTPTHARQLLLEFPPNVDCWQASCAQPAVRSCLHVGIDGGTRVVTCSYESVGCIVAVANDDLRWTDDPCIAGSDPRMSVAAGVQGGCFPDQYGVYSEFCVCMGVSDCNDPTSMHDLFSGYLPQRPAIFCNGAGLEQAPIALACPRNTVGCRTAIRGGAIQWPDQPCVDDATLPQLQYGQNSCFEEGDTAECCCESGDRPCNQEEAIWQMYETFRSAAPLPAVVAGVRSCRRLHHPQTEVSCRPGAVACAAIVGHDGGVKWPSNPCVHHHKFYYIGRGPDTCYRWRTQPIHYCWCNTDLCNDAAAISVIFEQYAAHVGLPLYPQPGIQSCLCDSGAAVEPQTCPPNTRACGLTVRGAELAWRPNACLDSVPADLDDALPCYRDQADEIVCACQQPNCNTFDRMKSAVEKARFCQTSPDSLCPELANNFNPVPSRAVDACLSWDDYGEQQSVACPQTATGCSFELPFGHREPTASPCVNDGVWQDSLAPDTSPAPACQWNDQSQTCQCRCAENNCNGIQMMDVLLQSDCRDHTIAACSVQPAPLWCSFAPQPEYGAQMGPVLPWHLDYEPQPKPEPGQQPDYGSQGARHVRRCYSWQDNDKREVECAAAADACYAIIVGGRVTSNATKLSSDACVRFGSLRLTPNERARGRGCKRLSTGGTLLWCTSDLCNGRHNLTALWKMCGGDADTSSPAERLQCKTPAGRGDLSSWTCPQGAVACKFEVVLNRRTNRTSLVSLGECMNRFDVARLSKSRSCAYDAEDSRFYCWCGKSLCSPSSTGFDRKVQPIVCNDTLCRRQYGCAAHYFIANQSVSIGCGNETFVKRNVTCLPSIDEFTNMTKKEFVYGCKDKACPTDPQELAENCNSSYSNRCYGAGSGNTLKHCFSETTAVCRVVITNDKQEKPENYCAQKTDFAEANVCIRANNELACASNCVGGKTNIHCYCESSKIGKACNGDKAMGLLNVVLLKPIAKKPEQRDAVLQPTSRPHKPGYDEESPDISTKSSRRPLPLDQIVQLFSVIALLYRMCS